MTLSKKKNVVKAPKFLFASFEKLQNKIDGWN
jgi:hypothetical protein